MLLPHLRYSHRRMRDMRDSTLMRIHPWHDENPRIRYSDSTKPLRAARFRSDHTTALTRRHDDIGFWSFRFCLIFSEECCFCFRRPITFGVNLSSAVASKKGLRPHWIHHALEDRKPIPVKHNLFYGVSRQCVQFMRGAFPLVCNDAKIVIYFRSKFAGLQLFS